MKVLKFGGTSVGSPQRIQDVATLVCDGERKHLYATPDMRRTTHDAIRAHFDYIRSFTKDVFTPHEERVIVAQGELLSTMMFLNLLKERGIKASMIPALDFMRIDQDGEPDVLRIHQVPCSAISQRPSLLTHFT